MSHLILISIVRRSSHWKCLGYCALFILLIYDRSLNIFYFSSFSFCLAALGKIGHIIGNSKNSFSQYHDLLQNQTLTDKIRARKSGDIFMATMDDAKLVQRNLTSHL